MMLVTASCSAQTTKSTSTQNTVAAQIDTVLCNSANIVKIVEVPNKSNTSVRTYAVYKDESNNISEIIPVSKTVLEYINLCTENNIKPNLGIRLKNGQIVSIVKYKTKYKVK